MDPSNSASNPAAGILFYYSQATTVVNDGWFLRSQNIPVMHGYLAERAVWSGRGSLTSFYFYPYFDVVFEMSPRNVLSAFYG